LKGIEKVEERPFMVALWGLETIGFRLVPHLQIPTDSLQTFTASSDILPTDRESNVPKAVLSDESAANRKRHFKAFQRRCP
jgi:hypothetical protein